MKKIFITLFCVLTLTSLSALSNNREKIYSVEGEEYEDISSLYMMEGLALPSSSGPWSEDELSLMLSKIDPSKLNDESLKIYNRLSKLLFPRFEKSEDFFSSRFQGEINIGLYFHTNPNGKERVVQSGESGKDNSLSLKEKLFQDDRELLFSHFNQKPFSKFYTELYMLSNFYGYFEVTLENNRYARYYNNPIGSSYFDTNLIMLRSFTPDPTTLDFNWPDRSFLSFGGKGWNIEIGRDKISWGDGKTGNLAISNNIPWQNFMRLSIYGKNFKYSLLFSFFPHNMNYWDGEDVEGKGFWHGINNHRAPLKGLKMYIAHRLEGRFFSDKLSLSITDGLIYMNESGAIDFSTFNPFNFNHNDYISHNSNSTLVFELNYGVIKGLNMYAQFIMDEVAAPFIETLPSRDVKAIQNAFGYLIGFEGILPLYGGLLSLSLEGVYTDPYLYLRPGNYLNNPLQHNYGINYIVALRNANMLTGEITYDEYTLGYTYGGDSIVGELRAEWKKEDFPFSFNGELFFMTHGTHDKWTEWQKIGGKKEDVPPGEWNDFDKNGHTPTTGHTVVNDKYPDYDKRDRPEYTIRLTLGSEYKLNKHFLFSLKLSYVEIINPYNIEGKNEGDFQIDLTSTFKF